MNRIESLPVLTLETRECKNMRKSTYYVSKSCKLVNFLYKKPVLTRLIRLDISKIPPRIEETKRITGKSDYKDKISYYESKKFNVETCNTFKTAECIKMVAFNFET